MNYLNRIKNLEKNISVTNKIQFNDLLKPEFKYTGKPFEDVNEAIKHCGAIPPESFSFAELQMLFEKGLIKYSIDETNKEMIRMM